MRSSAEIEELAIKRHTDNSSVTTGGKILYIVTNAGYFVEVVVDLYRNSLLISSIFQLK